MGLRLAKIQSLTRPDELKAIVDSLDLGHESGAALFVELGVRRAGTSYVLKRHLERSSKRAHLLGVDLDPGARRHWQRMMDKDRPKGRVTWSFELSTTEEAAKKDRAGPCAWVFVDACHCFECATRDIEQWGAKIAPHGVLVVHDTTVYRKNYTTFHQHGHTRPFGVYRAVEKSEADGFLSRGWRKVWDIDENKSGQNGVRVYQREG
jgi:methyltransferase family protein